MYVPDGTLMPGQCAPDRQPVTIGLSRAQESSFPQAATERSLPDHQCIAARLPCLLGNAMGDCGVEVNVVTIDPADTVAPGLPTRGQRVSTTELPLPPAPGLGVGRRCPVCSGKVGPTGADGGHEKLAEARRWVRGADLGVLRACHSSEHLPSLAPEVLGTVVSDGADVNREPGESVDANRQVGDVLGDPTVCGRDLRA